MPRILVVDDMTVDRALASGLLEQQNNMQIDQAENGALALEQIQRQPPDLVVSDLQMPEVDGLELVTRVRMTHPNIPVILMTAQGSEAIALEALEQGAAGYVPKSQLAAQLLDTANSVLAMSQAEHVSNRLLECQQAAEFAFALDSDPELLDALIDMIQSTVQGMGFADHTDKLRMGVAIREALLNALLHGSLELNPNELKSLDIAAQSLLIRERRAAAPYGQRKIHFSGKIGSDRAEFVVRDEGPGFDFRPYESRDLSSPESLDAQSRGIVLMRTFMDEVAFNEQGTEVRMVKRRR